MGESIDFFEAAQLFIDKLFLCSTSIVCSINFLLSKRVKLFMVVIIPIKNMDFISIFKKIIIVICNLGGPCGLSIQLIS